jgi:hypothetical protein
MLKNKNACTTNSAIYAVVQKKEKSFYFGLKICVMDESKWVHLKIMLREIFLTNNVKKKIF